MEPRTEHNLVADQALVAVLRLIENGDGLRDRLPEGLEAARLFREKGSRGAAELAQAFVEKTREAEDARDPGERMLLLADAAEMRYALDGLWCVVYEFGGEAVMGEARRRTRWD